MVRSKQILGMVNRFNKKIVMEDTVKLTRKPVTVVMVKSSMKLDTVNQPNKKTDTVDTVKVSRKTDTVLVKPNKKVATAQQK